MMACQEQKIFLQSDARSRDERKAKGVCRNKERCFITPGPSFFGVGMENVKCGHIWLQQQWRPEELLKRKRSAFLM